MAATRAGARPTASRRFWVALLAVAAFTLIWVYVIKPLRQIQHPYTVRAVRPAALTTWEVEIAPVKGETINFNAGQFVWLNIGHSPVSLSENPFSIASAPSHRDHLSFIIKEMGDFTGQIGQVVPGTRCYIDGPHGHLKDHGTPRTRHLSASGRRRHSANSQHRARVARDARPAPDRAALRQPHQGADRR